MIRGIDNFVVLCAVILLLVHVRFAFSHKRTFRTLRGQSYSKHVEDETDRVNSSVYRTANKYNCHYNQIDNPEMLIYGTKAWTFPRQNVNLTLTYPTEAEALSHALFSESGPYIITGFSVILFVDTSVTRGYITEGGILSDTIKLVFECDDVTTLLYDFWVYGVPRDIGRLVDVNVNNNLCHPDV